MDSNFSAEDLAFREEVRHFINTSYTDDLAQRIHNRESFRDGIVEWQQCLYEKGWVATTWPEEYGGTGWSVTQNFIWE